MLCGSCPYTDGLCYTTLPPKVKCTITNNFHYYDDACDCEDYLANKPSQEELDNIKKLLSEPLVFAGSSPVDDYAAVGICTTCIICEEEITGDFYHLPKICPACKKAIKFIKEKFKEELI